MKQTNLAHREGMGHPSRTRSAIRSAPRSLGSDEPEVRFAARQIGEALQGREVLPASEHAVDRIGRHRPARRHQCCFEAGRVDANDFATRRGLHKETIFARQVGDAVRSTTTANEHTLEHEQTDGPRGLWFQRDDTGVWALRETLALGSTPLSVVASSCSKSLLFLKPDGEVIELLPTVPLATHIRMPASLDAGVFIDAIEVRENGRCEVIRSSQHELEVTLTHEGGAAPRLIDVSGTSALCRALDANRHE